MTGLASTGSIATSAFPYRLADQQTFSVSAALAFSSTANTGATQPFGATSNLAFTVTAGGRKNQYFDADAAMLFAMVPNLRVAGKPFKFHALPQSYTFRAIKVDYEFDAVPRSYTFRSVR